MGKAGSTPTRVNADLAETAAVVAVAENRSFAEQINYWVRLGMQVERATSAEGRQVLEVATGAAQFSMLASEERTIAHATVDARMAERVAATSFGLAARKAGQVTVSIDDDGTLVEVGPDGSRRPL